MMTLFGDPGVWLPLVFAVFMGLSVLIYVILDGFDLGIGMLFPLAPDSEKEEMIATIGPFWDANETWLVMAVGLLLVAFPAAHGTILTALYLPVAILLLGLILRGVAYNFRTKVPEDRKHAWNMAFFWGSLVSSLSQGFMLGMYIMGLEYTPIAIVFSMLTAVCLAAGYAFIGAAWMLIKTDHSLQQRAARWARYALWGLLAGFAAVSLASPLASPRVFERWFSMPEMLLLAPLPVLSVALFIVTAMALRHLPDAEDRWSWVPFACATALFMLAFAGLAYSFYPYVVPDRMTIYEAASAPESLMMILAVSVFVLPTILAYTALVYFVFRGKATELRYD